MVASARLTLGGFLARFAFALLVAGATYNPTRYSYYAWVKSTGFEWRPPTVFVGVVLLIGWVVCLRLTLRSIGGLGLLLANAFLAALFWMYTPIKRLSRVNATMQGALAAGSRIFEVLDTHQEVPEAAGALELPRFQREIEYRDVGFRYADSAASVSGSE